MRQRRRCPQCGASGRIGIWVSENVYRKAWRMRGNPSVKICPTCGQNIPRRHRLQYVCLYCGYGKTPERKAS